MIKISRTVPRYNTTMLLALVFFWEGSTNTFQFPCGMLTLTLFDVAAITGLSPLSKKFTPTLETTNEFTIKWFSFKNFIIENHDKKNSKVSDHEHIAFLTLWLSYYIFYSSSLQVTKKFVPLAIQLHEGRKISLSKLILANLYQSLGKASYKWKHLPETNKLFLLTGPLWLLQLWLNATFEPKLQITEYQALIEQTGCRTIEGTRLAFNTPHDTSSRITFMKYIELFVESATFVSAMAPFMDRCVGTSWFRNIFSGVSPSTAAMSNSVWEAFLTHTLLSTRIEIGAPGYGFVGY